MVRSGLSLDGELLALACASHSGEDVPPRGRPPHPGRRRPERGGPAEHPRPALRRGRSGRAGSPRAASVQLAGAELLRQARRDAGHLRRERLGHWRRTATRPTRCSRRWPRPSRSWPASRWRPPAVDGCGAPVMAISLDRAGPGVRPPRRGRARARDEARVADGHPHPPGVARRHPPRRDRPDPRAARRRRQGRGRERLRRRAARRPRRRAEDRRRRPAGAAGRPGGGAAPGSASRRTCWPSWPTRRSSATASRSAPWSPSGSERAREGRPAAGHPRRGARRRARSSGRSTGRACWRWSASRTTTAPSRSQAMARKIAELRILRDERSVPDTGAPVLVVSQFTLYADTRKGRRPSWNGAAPGDGGRAAGRGGRGRPARARGRGGDRPLRRHDGGQPGQRRAVHPRRGRLSRTRDP